jgi:hypothetical protein
MSWRKYEKHTIFWSENGKGFGRPRYGEDNFKSRQKN